MKATALPGASPALVLPVPSGVAKYRCAIFAGPYGPLALSSGAADPSRPDVGTLSALRLKGSGEEFDEEATMAIRAAEGVWMLRASDLSI